MRLLIAAIAAIAALGLPAQAQTWPAKPIRMVIPYIMCTFNFLEPLECPLPL